ncbi:hypothetical protein [Halobellus rubicundus]|uniref:Uncharacterized protein n=1 Tax=Halobellus rubicundus TaxID=2996466 RepID=A0ABD5MD70_9EURY
MVSAPRSPIALLFGLAAVGVAIGGIGVAIGIGPATPDPGGAFVVSEDSVTVAGDGREAVVANDTSEIRSVEIERTGARRYSLSVDEGPLTERQRERAKAVARNNRTLRRYLSTVRDPRLVVEPIQRLDVGRHVEYEVSSEGGAGEGDASVFRVDSTSESGSVTVTRNRSYVPGEAVVRVRNATGETRYTAVVDLRNRTVTDVTDWEAIGGS